MKKRNFLLLVLVFIYACSTTQNVTKGDNPNSDAPQIHTQNLLWGTRDTSTVSFDGSGDGIFGRKIIYRSLIDGKRLRNINGTAAFLLCIKPDGIVNYAALIKDETTITDQKALLAYLNDVTRYKYEPLPTAPLQQCGKLTLKIYNTSR